MMLAKNQDILEGFLASSSIFEASLIYSKSNFFSAAFFIALLLEVLLMIEEQNDNYDVTICATKPPTAIPNLATSNPPFKIFFMLPVFFTLL